MGAIAISYCVYANHPEDSRIPAINKTKVFTCIPLLMINIQPQDPCIAVVRRGEKFRAASFIAWPVPGFKALYWFRDSFLCKPTSFEVAKVFAQNFATKNNILFLWKVGHLTLATPSWSGSTEWTSEAKEIESDAHWVQPVDPETQTPPNYENKTNLKRLLTKAQFQGKRI